MERQHIIELLRAKAFPDTGENASLVETHISWVILGDEYAFKIKKPVKFSFLDFSTVTLRAYYCRREVLLNARLAPEVYLKVLPVVKNKGKYEIILQKGEQDPVDYAVMMKRLPLEQEMDSMLKEGKVFRMHIQSLAEVIANFHQETHQIKKMPSLLDMQKSFNDIRQLTSYLKSYGNNYLKSSIELAIDTSNEFLKRNRKVFYKRFEDGFIKDCHGDLHTANIFLGEKPIVFDCIEFNDEFRHVDVLNDIAFLCMDLDFFGREDLSSQFLKHYLSIMPVIRDESERQLFTYYKLYRANVRAKILVLKAMETASYQKAESKLVRAGKYAQLMNKYVHDLQSEKTVKKHSFHF